MALVAALEADLRALSAEARRRYPAVKDGAEHAILKLRSSSSASDLSSNEDILRIFLMACGVRNTKLSVIGLSCLQKLISHDAVEPSSLKEILYTLKDAKQLSDAVFPYLQHSEMAEENIQLKTLQTILIIFQSRLHPETEDNMVLGLSICLTLLDNNRPPSVYNTAAATFRQAVALIFDQVVSAESLPMPKFGSSSQTARTGSVTGDLSQNINNSGPLEKDVIGGRLTIRDTLSETGKLGLRLLEDLTASAAGGSAAWLHVTSLPRTFSLELIEFVLSNYISVFKILLPYEQVLRHQICSLLMTSLRTSSELEGEMVEPYFRRLVLRSVAHIIRLYSSSLITECEVFLSMLVKATFLDLPLWHRILVLEILRGFCVEARTLRILFQNFDMHPKNTNVVESMVKALARVVSSIQFQETSEESLAAVAGMFSSKAKGIEWILDNDASSAAVLVASEAHAITLAIEGLLGVVFTVATLTDEAVDVGELESPRYEHLPSSDYTGKTSLLCISMVDSLWLTILDAFSLILSRSQGEAIVLEILKGYQAFTQACGVLHAVEPLNSFLASLCKFTIVLPTDVERKSVVQSPVSKRSEVQVDLKDVIVLTPKNVQALRTLFNIAHRLHNVLGPSWVLVLETLAALDRAIHSPHATTQEVATAVPKLTREPSRQYADFSILSSLNSQLFESSALMQVSSVKSLLSALHMLSHQSMTETSGSVSSASSKQIGSISFSVDRMISILVNNLHRVEPLWDQVVGHFLELAEHSNQNLRNMALDALDQSICAVLGSEQFGEDPARSRDATLDVDSKSTEVKSVECAVLSSLRVLYFSAQKADVRVGSLKILLHVLERCGEKLYYSWSSILEMLRSVADASEKDVATLGFQSLRVIMSDGLPTLPEDCLHVCIDVTGAYSAQKTDLNISLTAIGLLWTLTDFVAKGLHHGSLVEKGSGFNNADSTPQQTNGEDGEKHMGSNSGKSDYEAPIQVVNHEKLLFLVFSLIQKLVDDERPEVRNSAVRTFFQILGSHGNKLSKSMWEDCLWNYIFPMLDGASHKAATSSKDEWQGKEIGTRGGKAVHMLIHHSRNSAQKQWDETFVLVLGGIARLFRSYFPLLESLPNFWSGWESLLAFVKKSIFNGSKEVSLAAINCLQTAVVSHCVKGNLQLRYLNSVLDVYELVFQKSSSYTGDTAAKVKQEILHGLGELYVQSSKMFDDKMYMQLLGIVDLAIKQAIINSENFETEYGHVPPVLRHVLEILPSLGPPEHLSSMWLILLREFLHYLPRVDSVLPNDEGSEVLEQKADASSETIPTTRITTNMFAEKLIPALIELLLQAPAVEKYILFPEVIQNLRRCMMTRRDNPDGSLWKVAAEGFNRLLVEDVKLCSVGGETELKISKTARIRIWKEIGDVYDIFLVGYCGRALSSNSLPAATLKANETLEIALLNGLGDIILKSTVDAPREVLERLVSTLDRCASRTCSLPVETVELMPAHCSRFSLTCLQKLFSLSSSETENWHSTRAEVSKISITTLMARCEFILSRFLIDENNLGNRPIPTARLEEIIFTLQELYRLSIHPEVASVLPLQPYLKNVLREDNRDTRAHLLVLFPSLCEIVLSREMRVRELVQILLRAVATELGLEKVSLSS
ncbi:ARM repeat superfamily protein [Arabidopsis thaliana]|uniref:ARM repeat superfamily protein n=1 Tax=Arabidopsis thaliana TaxID=3702 RepID=F4K5S1_ARATH|nr:ARM repeat superfamily protein [Arabidopsis thaliana]AED93753.1 ARM repeat superfamily protein [Arabidopsis thaliana]|eukprot:NP_198149.2 ARM repeat superfamily protein [Arabidopsis thaliana]